MVVRRATISFVTMLFIIQTLILLSLNVSGEREDMCWVDANFEMDFISGTYIKMRTEINVHNISVYGKVFGADDIREIYDTEGGAFRAKVFDYVFDILSNHVFRGCYVNLSIPHAEENTLKIPSDSNPYNPPVKFIVDGNITLTGSFFNFDVERIDELVSGMLNVGSKIHYTFSFFSPPGWNITYILRAPQNITITETDGDLSVDGREVRWYLNNWDASTDESEIGITAFSRYQHQGYTDEEINANISFDMREIYYTKLNVTLNVESIYLSNVVNLPDFMSDISFYPSDAVRLLAKYGIISWDNVKNLLHQRWQSFAENLKATLNRNISLSFTTDSNTTTNCTDAFNISNMDTYPPLSIKAEGIVRNLFDDFPLSSVLGVVYAGGIVKIDSNLLDLNYLVYPFEANIISPWGNIYRWNNSTPLNITLFYKSKNYTDEKIERIVEVNVGNVGIDFPALFLGKKEIISSMEIREHLYIYRLNISDLLELPHWISINIIPSDLFRLFVHDNVINESLLDRIFMERVNSSREIIRILTGEENPKVYVDTNSFEISLTLNKNIEEISDTDPVDIPTTSLVNKKSKYRFSGTSLEIINESITCTSLPDEKITYRFVFPRGVKVVSCSPEEFVTKEKLPDGREYLEVVLPEGSNISATVTYSLRFSIYLVISLFMPLIIVTLIIVSIFALAIFMRRRRRYKILQTFGKSGGENESGEERK